MREAQRAQNPQDRRCARRGGFMSLLANGRAGNGRFECGLGAQCNSGCGKCCPTFCSGMMRFISCAMLALFACTFMGGCASNGEVVTESTTATTTAQGQRDGTPGERDPGPRPNAAGSDWGW